MELVPRENGGNSALIPHDESPASLSLPHSTLKLEGHGAAVNAVDFHPLSSEPYLLSCSFDKTALLWKLDENPVQAILSYSGHNSSVTDAKFINGGDYVVTTSADFTAAVYDMATAERVKILRGHESHVNCCASSTKFPSEKYLVATGSNDRTVRLWDGRSPRRGSELVFMHDYQVMALTFGETDDIMYSAGIDNDIYRWDIRKGLSKVDQPQGEASEALTRRLVGHGDFVTGLAVNPERTHLASNSADNTVISWDIRPFVPGGDDQRAVATMDGHIHSFERNLLRVGWASDNETIAAGSSDGIVVLWNGITGEPLRQLTGHSGSVNGIAWHPQRMVLASGSSDKSILLGEA